MEEGVNMGMGYDGEQGIAGFRLGQIAVPVTDTRKAGFCDSRHDPGAPLL